MKPFGVMVNILGLSIDKTIKIKIMLKQDVHICVFECGLYAPVKWV
jgi:hypothetical protein